MLKPDLTSSNNGAGTNTDREYKKVNMLLAKCPANLILHKQSYSAWHLPCAFGTWEHSVMKLSGLKNI